MMPLPSPPLYDAADTARRLAYPKLVDALALAVLEHSRGEIRAPERQVVPFPAGGVMLSMPATAHDIGIHKLVNVFPDNHQHRLPTINGVVSVYDGSTGRVLGVLDGPTVTARRTAALSMLGIRTFLHGRVPSHVVLIGTGTQSVGHAQALAALYAGLRVTVLGTSAHKSAQFVHDHAALDLDLHAHDHIPDDADVVITLTTSRTPVYHLAARADRLLIGVGAFKPELAEIAPDTLRASRIFVDDPAGARHEAGDLIQARCNWDAIQPLAAALQSAPDRGHPVVFKTVGCAAWDLAAARCALT